MINLNETQGMTYNRLTLSFPAKEEALFLKKYFIESVFSFRIAFASVIILYAAFGYLDLIMFPEYVGLFHIIRFIIVIPILSIVLVLSFTKVFQKIWQLLIFIGFIVGGSSIGVMTMLVPDNYAYYAGMMLIFSAGYFFVKLRFLSATIAGWIILLVFNIGAIFYAHVPNIVLISTNFFFISANFIGMFAAYNIEYQSRRNFFLNRKLDDEKLGIVKLNKNLENIVIERTKELLSSKEHAEESELQFKSLFEGAADAIFIADVENGIILDVNHAAERLMQMPKNNIVGLHQSMLHPQEMEQRSKETFRLHQQIEPDSIKTMIIENIVVRLDGTEVPVEISASRTLYKGNKSIVGTFRDISDRKKAEIELLIAKEATEAINANITAIIEGTTNSIWAFDREFKILYINHVFQQEFYHAFGVHLGPGVDLIEALPEAISSFWKSRYERVLDNEQFTIEDAVDTGRGIVYIEIAFTPIIKNGQVVGGSCFGSDITARKQAEMELLKAKESAIESDRLKSAFLANMSHEIRTPMNGILGFAELLKEQDLNGEERQEYIRIIQKSGDRMLNIINDIVDISKIEAGLMGVKIKESDLNKQMDYIHTFFKPEAEKKGLLISLKKDLLAKEVSIATDREKLYAILTNLVKNAIKYTNHGKIEIGFEKKGNNIEFFVKDTGIGIPKDRQSAIFERFIQADIADKMARQGAGLGLSISKAFLEMLGGEIWVESEEGKGSAFYFTLPYSTVQKEEIIIGKEAETDKTDAQVDTRNPGLKILIAEDDAISASLITIFLKELSTDITHTMTGVEIVEACRNNSDVDLILMDIQLPILNGYEATRQIRKFNKDVIIIAQTAYGLSGDKEKAIEAGCSDYISKPISKVDLYVLIDKHLAKKVTGVNPEV